MHRQQDLGKDRFSWLLRQRGLLFFDESRLEERIQVRSKRPDFYVEPSSFPPILVEVEGFSKRDSHLAVPERILKRLRVAVGHAASQLAPYREMKIPTLVVLDNARKVRLPLGKNDLLNLFGLLEWHKPINVITGDSAGPAYLTGSDDSFHVLGPEWNNHVSAVAVNLPKDGYQYDEPPERERPMRLRVLHNPYASVPLPARVFDDAEDENILLVENQWRVFRGTDVP